MKINQEEKERLETIYQTFLHDEKILKMKEISMHRGSNCYEHSFKVARKAIRHALRYHKKEINLEIVLIGSILHDYYLYDWRQDRSKLKGHGKNHPVIAAKNAKEDFNIPDKSAEIILSHMWPINIRRYPHSKEAKILSYADKRIAMKEAFSSRRRKEKKHPFVLNDIAKLF